MVHSSCTERRKSFQRPRTEKQVPPRRTTTQETARLIERTRQLMEQTIEFVDHPLFVARDVLPQLKAMRPASVDQRPVVGEAAAGIAFVSGLVKAPLLTPDEERYWFLQMNFLKWRAESNRRQLNLNSLDQSLVDQIQADIDEATRVRNLIVQGNLRLIVAFARRLTNSVEQMSELISEGMIPLIRSVELFDIGLGNRFSTYATWSIRNQMLRLLKRIRTSPEQTTLDNTMLLETIPDQHGTKDTEAQSEEIHHKTITQLLSSLPARERAIITARFGFEGHPQGQSLAEIGSQLGISKERVRQILLSSLSKLRNEITRHEHETMT
jgi:RNA polymerase primary sigma factor